MTAPAPISIVIPAYNEEAVIARTLTPLCAGARAGRLQVIVVANGCKDATARVAREACPAAQVIETEVASKTNALNLATEHVAGRAVVFLDGDLVLSEPALQTLVAPILANEADVANGRMVVDTAHASGLVRAFYRGWALNPYFDKGKFGGVYALSAQVHREIFPIDSVVADDELVARHSADKRHAYAPEATFTVTSPATLRDLIRIRRRSRRGTAALETAGLSGNRASSGANFATVLRRGLSQPARLPDVLTYAAVILWVRLGLRLNPPKTDAGWERDASSRLASSRNP